MTRAATLELLLLIVLIVGLLTIGFWFGRRYERDHVLEEPDEPTPPLQPPPWTGTTLDSWRDNPQLVQFAIGLYATPQWHCVMEVLWAQMPVAVLTADTDYSAQVGRSQGYREAIAVLMELPKSTPVSAIPPAVDYSGDAFGEAADDRA